MGWFWADAHYRPLITTAAPSSLPDARSPPSDCPMQTSPSESSPSFPPRAVSANPPSSSCPVKSPNQPANYPSSSSSNSTGSPLSKLNPLNYMPYLSNKRESLSPQNHDLPLVRETSSIRRGDADTNWEYPSPQQMYNAMLRKGYTDTDVSAVESMVAVHNFLNEGAWAEIKDWESIFAGGLTQAWQKCKEGEEGLALFKAKKEYEKYRRESLGLRYPRATASDEDDLETEPRLLRFQGRPGQPTPKSRILGVLSRAFPGSFSQEPPFDRHDWYVARRQPGGTTKEIRYVIDYYGGGLQATGEPVFYLDIRPALDTPTAAAERLMRWGGDVWWRASGGSARKNSTS